MTSARQSPYGCCDTATGVSRRATDLCTGLRAGRPRRGARTGRTPWKRWVFLVVLVLLLGTWYVGKLDRYIPKSISSAEVLGDAAPIVKAAKEKAAAEAAAPPAKP